MRENFAGRFVAAIICLAGGAVGCGTKLLPQGEGVRIAEVAEDVRGCALIATVRAKPPYMMPNEDLVKLRNETAALGGNVVFVTNRFGGSEGAAYRCPR